MEELAQLRRAGKEWKEIAQRFDKPISTVKNSWYKYVRDLPVKVYKKAEEPAPLDPFDRRTYSKRDALLPDNELAKAVFEGKFSSRADEFMREMRKELVGLFENQTGPQV